MKMKKLLFTSAILTSIAIQIFSQIVINEVYIRPDGLSPTPPNGIVYVDSKEYIEIYNKSCQSVDISGYFIATKQEAFQGTFTGFTIRIPDGTVMPPLSHLVFGSSQPGGFLVGNIDIPVTAAIRCGYNGNLVVQNVDGWLALYNNNGVALDCVYWTGNPNNITSAAGDYNPGAICLPAGSPAVTLQTARQIYQSNPSIVSYVANSTPIIIYRATDGSPSWQFTATFNAATLPSTINKSAPTGNCNGGVCFQPFEVTSTFTNPSCGANNGSITLTVTPTGTYTYTWTGGLSGANPTGVGAGTYSVTVSDGNCTWENTFNLTSSGGATISLNSKQDETCSLSNGSISVTVSGGTTPYNFVWSNGQSGANLSTISGLQAGQYCLTVTDAASCQSTFCESIVNIPGPTISSTSSTPDICSQGNGTATVTPSVNPSQCTYLWTPSGQTTQTATNLSAGTYTCVVNYQGCTVSASVVVTAEGTLEATISSTNPTCAGVSDGSINITIGQGTPPFTFLWSNGATTQSLTGLNGGTYSVTITSGDNCERILSATLTEPSAIILSLSNMTDICEGSQNGTATVTATGGTPPYTYQWSNGSSSASQTTLTAGTHYITVTDSNSCTAIDSVNIQSLPIPNVMFTGTPTNGCVPVTVTFQNQSDVGTYLWNFGNGSTSTSMNPVYTYTNPGNYTVSLTVTSSICSATHTIPNFINVYPIPVANFNLSSKIVKEDDGMVFFTDLSVGASSWLWDFGDNVGAPSTVQNPNYTYTIPGTYSACLNIENQWGCSNYTCQQIIVNPFVSFYIPNAFSPNGDGMNDYFMPFGVNIQPEKFSMRIFNRWGEMVFSANDFNSALWDGTHHFSGNTDIVPQGVYVYKIEAVIDSNLKRFHGIVTVIY